MGLLIPLLIVFSWAQAPDEKKNGELFEAATLDQIWPVKKPLPKQFWWDDVPTPASTTQGELR